MPIGIIEGFDVYLPSLAMADGSAAQVWQVSPAGGGDHYSFVTGLGGQGKAIRMTNNTFNGNGPDLWKVFPPSGDITFAFAIQHHLWDTIPEYIWLGDDVGAHQFGFSHTNLGKIRLHGEGSAVLATSTLTMQLGQIYRFVCQVHSVSPNIVNITVKINGTLDEGLSVEGVDLHDSGSALFGLLYIANFAVFNNTDAHDYILDDILLLYDELVDLPPIEIFSTPSTDTIEAEWTPFVAGENHTNVDDIPINGDTDYNEAVANDLKDILLYPNPTRVPAYVHSISLLTVGRKDEAAVRGMRNVIRVNGTDYTGPDFNLAEVYAHYLDHWQTNPETDEPWLPAEIPIHAGYESRT